jgi:hypothetical protein
MTSRIKDVLNQHDRQAPAASASPAAPATAASASTNTPPDATLDQLDPSIAPCLDFLRDLLHKTQAEQMRALRNLAPERLTPVIDGLAGVAAMTEMFMAMLALAHGPVVLRAVEALAQREGEKAIELLGRYRRHA